VIGERPADQKTRMLAGARKSRIRPRAAYRGRRLPHNFPKATLVHEDLAAFADFLIAREAAMAVLAPE
jgi:hypothetical protein